MEKIKKRVTNLKVAGKLKVYRMTVLVMTLFLVLVALISTLVIRLNIEKITEVWSPSLEYLQDLETMTAKYRIKQYQHLVESDAAVMNSCEEEIKKLKRAKADPIIAPSKGQVLWEVSVEGPSSAPFIGRKYQHDEVFCYLSTPWGEYEKIWTGFTGRVVEVCAKQGDVVNKGDVIAYIQRSDIFA